MKPAARPTGNKDSAAAPASLRRRAEERLKKVQEDGPALTDNDQKKLLHELQVHQIELEMQNRELVQSRDEAEAAKEKYLELYDFAPVGYFTLDGKGTILGLNLTGAALLSRNRQELIGHNLLAFLTRESYPHFNAFLIAAKESGGQNVCELELAGTKGRAPVFVRIEGTAWLRKRRNLDRIQIMISDITTQKEAEASVIESEEWYRRLFETALDGILILDGESGEILNVNRVMLDLLGYPQVDFISRHLSDLGFIQDKSFAHQALAELKTNRYVRYNDLHLGTIQGTLIRMEVIGNAYLVGERRIIQCNFRDITVRKQMEDALQQANRQINLMTSITRHDISNHLLVIFGFLGIAEKQCTDPALREYFRKITTAANGIRSQIEFTKIYQKLGSQEPQWQDLNRTLSQSPLPETITLDSDMQGVEVYADLMLEKVFSNLLDNAIRHGEHVTKIRVSSRKEGKGLTIIWEDNGVGIASAEKERIFERGFGKNSGLGMFLGREILLMTGITIKETGESGTGARFEITVPEGAYRSSHGTVRPT